MTLEPHIHCAECGCEIRTSVPERGGKTRPAEIHAGQQVAVVMTPQGPGFVPRPVPLCDECAERLAKAERPRLVVPKGVRPS